MAGTIHLVGIGGVGMSALAQVYLDAGYAVSGADRTLRAGGTRTPVLDALAAQGVRLSPDDGSGVDAATEQLVVSTAIEDANPDLAAARARGIPVVHRAAALSQLLSRRRLVAVAGTCGKSTVTAILGHLLAECGFDPLVVNGAQIAGWDAGGMRVGSVRKGAGEYAVAEVDESDKSLTAFKPYAAIVTNASADHYSKEEMDAVFDAFVRDVPGPVVDGRDPSGNRHACRLTQEMEDAVGALPMPGAHNRANARLALAMACALGVDPTQAAAALASFPGVERRLQRVGALACGDRQVAVYDDYAHNPEKLRGDVPRRAASAGRARAAAGVRRGRHGGQKRQLRRPCGASCGRVRRGGARQRLEGGGVLPPCARRRIRRNRHGGRARSRASGSRPSPGGKER